MATRWPWAPCSPASWSMTRHRAGSAHPRRRRQRLRHPCRVRGQRGSGLEPPTPGARRPSPGQAPVRRLARDLCVDLADLASGAGPGGIITRGDVLAAASAGTAADRRVPAPGSRVRRSPLRRRPDQRAARWTRSCQCAASVPHCRANDRSPQPYPGCYLQCQPGLRRALLDLRAVLNSVAERIAVARVITPFALIARLLVHALTIHPVMNSAFVEDGPSIRRYGAVPLGVATATDRGLLVPVVRSAECMSTLQLTQGTARRATAARAGTATPPSSAAPRSPCPTLAPSVSTRAFRSSTTPKRPVLGVGSVKRRPVVLGGNVVGRPTATLTRVCDPPHSGRRRGWSVPGRVGRADRARLILPRG